MGVGAGVGLLVAVVVLGVLPDSEQEHRSNISKRAPRSVWKERNETGISLTFMYTSGLKCRVALQLSVVYSVCIDKYTGNME